VKRTSLATRISLLSVGIAVITALFAGLLAAGLIRSSGADTAQRNLARIADVAQSAASSDAQVGVVARKRLRIALEGLRVHSGIITPAGRILARSALVRDSLTGAEIATVLAGHEVSAGRVIDGTHAFVEARPISRGGFVVVERRSDAVAQNERAIRRIVLAAIIAGGAAALLGFLVAWRLARPLRRTAAAAHSLALGNRDVTLPAAGPAEVAEVSEAINALSGALRHSEARQRDFLLSVSHDLRTPLTAISGYAESLAGGVVGPDEAAEVGGVMLGEAKRLERLVGDLLDLARLGAQDFRVEFAPVDLVAFVGDTARAWAARCAAAGVAFRLDAPSAQVWAHTDPARVRQVLDGLLDNALRVTPTGAPIVLATRAEPGHAVLEVRDGGPGLRDDDLAVAFEQGVLFQRYRGIRQVGTGLGLAIVRGLVERLGGRVEAGHAAEGGARFTVRLPQPN
jgi:two-component system sensor histidine kinase BaeS